jgi:hypothetical protein
MVKPPGFEVALAVCRFQFEFRGTGESLVENIRAHVGRAGGELTGSATSGNFTLSTPVGAFHGGYTISGQTIFLEVADKPFFVPCGAIEARLAAYIKEST